jgi:hypothetical protein|tara:strand:- start:1534 stop:1671 length:138 start_codon:yes stop_codon:yes gene_type:complete
MPLFMSKFRIFAKFAVSGTNIPRILREFLKLHDGAKRWIGPRIAR